MSIQDLQQNPQETSNFYLANIYQATINPNGLSSLPASPPPFSPPTYAVWVNSLWFLSLVISLTCALLATFLQQWARRYLKVTQSRYSPHKRARIRAFFSEGVEKLLLPWTVETLPTLLHISLFLFFAGLVVFLRNVNLTIFKLVLSWVGLCTALYGCITLVPVFRHDSPYYTPLSLPAWHIVTGIQYLFSQIYWWFHMSIRYRRPLIGRYFGRARIFLLQGLQRSIEETALKSPSEKDARAFMWTFECLDEDHELERFFSGLPGFRSSKVVDDPLPRLTGRQKLRLGVGLMELLDRTFSSDLLPAHIKKRRAMLCAKVTDPVHIPLAFDVFDKVLSNYQDDSALAVELLQIIRAWGNGRDNDTNADTNLIANATICSIIARAQQHDDPWFILASSKLGVSESVLRDYAACGDGLSLAILIHIVRQYFRLFRKTSGLFGFVNVLGAVTRFNARDTPLELQHEFCALWNQIVLESSEQSDWTLRHVLRQIWSIYIALHQDIDPTLTQFAIIRDRECFPHEPHSYPVCNVADHIRDETASAFGSAMLSDNAAMNPASLAGLDPPSSSAQGPLQIVENVNDVPPLDSLHITHQTTVESLRIPTASTDPATDCTVPGIIGSTPRRTAETSLSASSLLSISPPPAVGLQHNTDPLAPPDSPFLVPAASSNPVIVDNVLPAGSLQSLHSPKM